jgi:O-antigen ligase
VASGATGKLTAPPPAPMVRAAEVGSRAVVIALAGCFGFSFGFHGLYAYQAWAPVTLGVLALVVVAVAVRRLELTSPAWVALQALAFLLLWTALSATWAPSIDRAWVEADRLGLYCGVLVVGLAVLRTPEAARLCMRVFALAAGAAAVYTLARMLAGSAGPLFFGHRLNGPLGYINGEAGLFLMGLWPLVAEAERARTAVVRGAALAGAVLVGNLVVLTQSRAIVPAIVGVVLLVLLLPGRLRRGWLLVLLGAAIVAALPTTLDVYAQRGPVGTSPGASGLREAAVAILIAMSLAAAAWVWLTRPAVVSRLVPYRRLSAGCLAAIPLVAIVAALVVVPDPAGELRHQWSSFRELNLQELGGSRERFTSLGGYRYDLWRIALNQGRDHPLRGVGAGNYDSTYYRERRTDDFVRQPHSLELQMFGELGIPGGLAILLFGAAVVWSGLRPGRKASIRGDLAVRVAAIGIFGAWLVHTSVDWLWNIPGLTGIALLAAGALLARQVPDERPPGGRSLAWNRLAVGSVVVVVVVVATSIGRHYAATRNRLEAESRLARDPSGALEPATRAIRLNPHDVMAYIVLASAHARRGEYEPARSALARASDAETFNYLPWLLMGDIAIRRGDPERARRAYRRARFLNPRSSNLTLGRSRSSG